MKRKYQLLARQIAKTFNIYDIAMNSLYKIRNLKLQKGYRRFQTTPFLSSEITAVILTSSKSRFFDECLNSIKNQILKPKDILVG